MVSARRVRAAAGGAGAVGVELPAFAPVDAGQRNQQQQRQYGQARGQQVDVVWNVPAQFGGAGIGPDD